MYDFNFTSWNSGLIASLWLETLYQGNNDSKCTLEYRITWRYTSIFQQALLEGWYIEMECSQLESWKQLFSREVFVSNCPSLSISRWKSRYDTALSYLLNYSVRIHHLYIWTWTKKPLSTSQKALVGIVAHIQLVY